MVIVAGWLAFACFGVATLALISLHVGPGPADPVSEGVSAYGLGPHARLYQLQVVASGIGGLPLGVALVVAGAAPLAIVALLAYGVTRVAIAAYPTDPRGSTKLSPTGRMHALLAAVAFLAMAIAAPLATATLPADVTGDATMLLAILATVTSLGSFAVAASRRAGRFYGLAQRAFYVTSFGWALLLSVSLATQLPAAG